MPAINNDQKWEVSGRGMGVTCLPPPTRSLPSSPPRIEHLKRMSLSAMLGEYHRDEMHRDLPMTSSLPCNSLQGFRAMGESIEMTNDLLDLSKPLPWDRLKRGASTMSLDSLNENYMESVPGEMAVLEDQDKTPVATCTCGKTTNFECWVHRVPFSGAGELTEEISQTCLQLVKELRSEPSGCDGVINDPSYENKHDYGGLDLHLKDSPPTNHVRESVDTPCSWKKERISTNDLVRDLDTPSSKSSGSLASAPSIHRSELSSSPDSYDLLYKSFEVAAEMDRLQLERGQSEGSSVGSSLESLNRTSPKLQKVLSQKRRSSPDGSGESPTDVASCDSITGSQKNLWLALQPQYNPQPLTLDTYRYEVIHKEDTCSNDTSQKVTFASLAKKKKKPEVTTSQVLPSEVTHWTELVTLGLPKEESCLQPHTSPISSSKCEAGNKSKRPHSLPIQLRHIQKPSSRPQQTPEQSQQGNTGGAPAGIKGVTRTVSAPEGFACSFPRSAGSGQDLSLTKMTSWVVPAASQSTSSVSLLTRKRHYNQHYHTTPQLDPTIGCEGSTDPKMAAGSPLINSSMQDSGHGMRDLSYPLGYDSNAQMPVRATRARIFAMDINANFTEPQEQDTFIPEHHHFIPQEITSETGNLHRESPTSSRVILGNPLQDRLHFRSNLGVESSADWVPGPRTTWLDTNRRTVIPPRTLNLITQEEVRPLQKKAKELQTCSRGCSTNSPPEVDPTSFLRMYPRTYKENELMAKDQTKECKDVGVSTDETLNGKGGCFCPCAKNYHHIADINQSTQTLELRDQSSQSDLPSRCLLDSGDRSESGNISKIVKGESLDKGSQVGLCQDAKDQSRLDKRTLEKSVQGSKAGRKSKPKVRQGKDCTKKAVPTETSVQSWRVGGKGRRGSRTIVTCEESHIADALTNRVVRIQNVGASTLPASADKKYIRHRPLKPIHQVDAEHQQRKVLQKLCGNADQPVAPLPPTVIAWPGLQDSMHSRADRVNSLPADLSQYRSWGTAASNPQPGQSQPLSSAGVSTAGQPIKRILSWESGAERHSIDKFQLDANGTSLKGRPLSLDVSSDYDVGADCLPPQEMQVSPREAKEEVDLVQKKALVTAVEGAVEHILSHFGQAKTKSLEEKGRLGSTALTPDIGHLMLHYLCPAIRALLLDGLRPHVTSFFVGRLKTTLWGVVEATTQLGPGTRPLHELVRQLSQLAYLKTSDLRVNAFIMGLLNIRCLELWLEHIRDHPDIVRNLYEPNAFLSLCNGATKAFFDRLLIAIQPLTLLPFDLDYKFEHQGLVHQLNQQREKQQLMDRYAGKPNSSTLLTQSHTSVGGSWLKGTASLLWKNWERTQKPEEPASSGTMTSSLGFLRNIKGQRSVERTKNSRSSEQPVSGMLKTDENSTPTQGVDPTRDSFSNKEVSNSWSLEWIKGFVAASTEATTSNAGVSSTKNMTSSGSTWSRFGSSLSKAFDRIRPDSIATTTQRQPVRQEWPSRTSDKETISPKQVASPRKMESPSSPVAPGSPVKARCHHVTMSKEQLSFTKGSILTVQQQVDPDWLMCSQGDQSGLVHIDYVQGME